MLLQRVAMPTRCPSASRIFHPGRRPSLLSLPARFRPVVLCVKAVEYIGRCLAVFHTALQVFGEGITKNRTYEIL